jgi:hypothetical protein
MGHGVSTRIIGGSMCAFQIVYAMTLLRIPRKRTVNMGLRP